MHNQNPEKYAVKKGITNDQIEKHMQGIYLLNYEIDFLPPVLIDLMSC